MNRTTFRTSVLSGLLLAAGAVPVVPAEIDCTVAWWGSKYDTSSGMLEEGTYALDASGTWSYKLDGEIGSSATEPALKKVNRIGETGRHRCTANGKEHIFELTRAEYDAYGVKNAPSVATRTIKQSLFQTLFGATEAYAAITANTGYESVEATGTSITFSATVPSGSDQALVVGIFGNDPTSTDCVTDSVTFNGDTVTEVQDFFAPTVTTCTSLHYRVAPDVTTANVVATMAGTVTELYGVALSFDGVAQTGTVDTSASQEGASGSEQVDTLTLANTGEVMISAHINGENNSGDVTNDGTTVHTIDFGGDNAYLAYSIKAGSGSQSITWTFSFNQGGSSYMALVPAGAAPPPASGSPITESIIWFD